MSAQTNVSSTTPRLAKQTANDRFKRSFGSVFWGSVCIAVLLHFLLLELFPMLSAGDMRVVSSETEIIDIPPEIEIPPPPEQIARPAMPVVAETEIEDDVTIAVTTLEDNPIDQLPPPTRRREARTGPTFTPYEVAPRLLNESHITRILARDYPPLLRDAGIGGTVVMWYYIDAQGQVQETQIHRSSGHPQLDRLAERIAQESEFTPARNMDRNVAVWIQMPIKFEAR